MGRSSPLVMSYYHNVQRIRLTLQFNNIRTSRFGMVKFLEREYTCSVDINT